MATSINTNQIIPGFNGKLYDSSGNFLTQVNTFQCQINVTNTNYQAAGSGQEIGILQSYHVTLTFTETLINDSLISTLTTALTKNQQPSFNFQGEVTRPDGKTGRYVFRSCAPQGNIDVLNVQPGQIMQRAWSFDVNQPPEIQTLLPA